MKKINYAKFLVDTATNMFKKAILKIEKANNILEESSEKLLNKQEFYQNEITEIKYEILDIKAEIESNNKLKAKLKEFAK